MLDDTQARLRKRYKELSAARQASGYPVYALEHGLDRREIDELRAAASSAIRYLPPSENHWLVWAALGAEAGYAYSDEYWPTLERSTGEWRSNDFRQTLRKFYCRFNENFRGPRPVGRWAQHFSIIAWPIAHAILPKYLQASFASHLFDVKHDLARLAQSESGQLGEFLFQQYTGPSSRLRDFLQQTDLTSQIVLALRDLGQSSRIARIEDTVLERIVNDLEERRDARDYFRDARKYLQSTSLKVSAALHNPQLSTRNGPTSNAAAILHTRLIARRRDDGSFVLGVILPNLEQILSDVGLSQSDIANQRIRFVGDNERFVPASTLLTLSCRERKLDQFPRLNTNVVIAEDNNHPLAAAIDQVMCLEERSAWLLRRHADGRYREVTGGHVRTGQDYLILTRVPIDGRVIQGSGVVATSLIAHGVYAYRLINPDHMSVALNATLKQIGIGTKTGVLIEPVGMNPSPSLFPTWQTTEPVILRISADFDLKDITVRIDDGPPTTILMSSNELLIKLDPQEPGNHYLSVAIPAFSGRSDILTSEQFRFSSVAPKPWRAAMLGKSGFRLILDPSNASIEDIVARRATLQVFGPPRRSVRWSVDTYDSSGHLITCSSAGVSKIGEPPSSVQMMLKKVWDAHFDNFDDAHQVDLVANLDELGRQACTFALTVEPLRWKFDSTNDCIRLIDETDHADEAKVSRYSLDNPLRRNNVDVATALTGISLTPPGSLLTAKCKGIRTSVVVSLPPPAPIMNLAEIGLSQTITLPDGGGIALINLIDGIRFWKQAKPIGRLAPLRRDTTVDKLQGELTSLCCGREFANVLASQDVVLEHIQLKVGGSKGFGYRMRTFSWPVDLKNAVGPFQDFSRIYQVETDSELARHALTLAYAPLSLRLNQVQDKPAYLSQLLRNRTILRGAFLARAVALAAVMPPIEVSA